MRTLLVDDNEDFLHAATAMLGTMPEIELVGCAMNAEDAFYETAMLEPDLVLMDVRIPGASDLEVARILRTFDPQPEIVMMTFFDNLRRNDAVYQSGAIGQISKSNLCDELRTLIRRKAKS